jgi:hypothetical protein
LDSDFEVFVDPTGSHHNYKELEINALNTVWNLCLDKPYTDHGHEHSGRVAADPEDPDYYEVYQQKKAVKVVAGKLNDPRRGALWTVELALAYSDLCRPCSSEGDAPWCAIPPRVGDRWRINFSRVEKQGDVNWTWQPQVRWDPALNRFRGIVDMHLPDAWGYLQFGDIPTSRDPTWPAKLTATTVYYALHHFQKEAGEFTSNVSDLCLPKAIVEPFHVDIQTPADRQSFLVIVRGREDGTAVSIRDDRLLSVLHWQSHASQTD